MKNRDYSHMFQLAETFAKEGLCAQAMATYQELLNLAPRDPRLIDYAEFLLDQNLEEGTVQVVLSLLAATAEQLEEPIDRAIELGPIPESTAELLQNARSIYERCLNTLLRIQDDYFNPDVGLALYMMTIYLSEMQNIRPWCDDLLEQTKSEAQSRGWDKERWITYCVASEVDEQDLKIEALREREPVDPVGAAYYRGQIQRVELEAQIAYESIPSEDAFYAAARVALVELSCGDSLEDMQEGVSYAEDSVRHLPKSLTALSVYLDLLCRRQIEILEEMLESKPSEAETYGRFITEIEELIKFCVSLSASERVPSINEDLQRYMAALVRNEGKVIIKSLRDIVPVAERSPSAAQLIKEGEGDRVEFKQTYHFDIRSMEASDHVLVSSLKTIAGFLNADGGTLLIGVSDSKEISGLERDFSLCKSGKQDPDGLQLKIRERIRTYLDPTPLRLIKIRFEEDDKICRIDVKRSGRVVHLIDEAASSASVFVRDGNQTLKLTGSELTEWTTERSSE